MVVTEEYAKMEMEKPCSPIEFLGFFIEENCLEISWFYIAVMFENVSIRTIYF